MAEKKKFLPETIDFLDKLKFDPNEGILTLLGIRYVMFTTETIHLLLETMENTLGRGAKTVLYQAGKNIGVSFAREMQKKLETETTSLSELAEALIDALSEGGFGLATIESLDKKKTIITLKNSYIATEYGNVGHPTCHLLRGFFAGQISEILETDLDASEEMCVAKGDEVCKFIIVKKK